MTPLDAADPDLPPDDLPHRSALDHVEPGTDAQVRDHEAMQAEIGAIRDLLMEIDIPAVPGATVQNHRSDPEKPRPSNSASDPDAMARVCARLDALEQRSSSQTEPKHGANASIPWGGSQGLLAAWIDLSYRAFMQRTPDLKREGADRSTVTTALASVFDVYHEGEWHSPNHETLYKTSQNDTRPNNVLRLMQEALDRTRKEQEARSR